MAGLALAFGPAFCRIRRVGGAGWMFAAMFGRVTAWMAMR